MKNDNDDFHKEISFLKSEINRSLKKILVKSEPKYLYDPIKYSINNSGKRLRPILVFLSGKLFNANVSDLMKAAVAVELLHIFTLIHDDIMDDDDIRHGKPSLHKKWDISTAILSGDAIFTLAQLAINSLDKNTYSRLNEISLSVCEGQALDKEFENDTSISMDKYLDMIAKKTGSLLGLCSELGAIVSEQEIDIRTTLYSFGVNLGLAFQIQDDYLEIFGEPELMGKSLGSDIHSGKQTAMTILARNMNEKEWIRLNSKKTDLQGYKNFFLENRIDHEIKKLVEYYINKTSKSIEFVKSSENNFLDDFSNYILNRRY
ncbi:MAG: polyprenyl synthetase family protein [bacterium TMED144]|nr:MAG: polyprenyl synthetase family protein [bacterium TMED144]